MHDALRQPRRAGGVVELRGIVGSRIERLEAIALPRQGSCVEHEHPRLAAALEARRVVGVRDEQLGLGVAQAVRDALVSVQHGHRQQDRAELPRAEEHGRRLRCGRQHDSDAVAPLDAHGTKQVGRPVGELLQLAPGALAHGAVVAFVDHRQRVRRSPVADVGSDVVALRDLPAVLAAQLLMTLAAAAAALATAFAHRDRTSAARSVGGWETACAPAACARRRR